MVAARTLQRKLGKLWQDFLHRPTMVELVENLQRNAKTEIFFDGAEIEFEDASTFQSLVESAFGALARVKGKSAAATRELDEFLATLERALANPTGKRAYDEEPTETSTKRVRNVKEESQDSMSREQKASLKSIVDELCELPESEAFHYPVDKSAYPEYYELVARPMDFATLRKKISSYGKAKDALKDLRRIWMNCLEFNQEKSAIAQQALKVAARAEKLIENEFGKEFADSTWMKKLGRPTKTKTSPIMESILQTLMNSKFAHPFLNPVDPNDAPGYLDVVDHPMDLSTVKKNLSSGLYGDDSSAFLRHLQLIWANCLIYNDPDSEIAQWANKLSALTSKLAQEHGWTVKQSSVGQAVEAIDLPKGPDADMRTLILKLEKFEYIEPFLVPVDPSEVPDYSCVVKRPMDLSTVKKNLHAGAYSTPSKFVADVRLIWSNAKLYNGSSSGLFNWAVQCEEYFEAQLAKISSFSIVKLEASGSSFQKKDKVDSNSIKSEPRKHASAPTPILDDDDDEDVGDEDDLDDDLADDDQDEMDTDEVDKDANGGDQQRASSHGKSKKKRNRVSFRVRKYRSVLRQVCLHDQSEPFKSSEIYSGLSGITNHIDLTTIRPKIDSYQDSPLRFLADMKLVFDNFLLNADSKAPARKAAEIVKAFAVEMFFKNFPSLASVTLQGADAAGEVRKEVGEVISKTQKAAVRSVAKQDHPMLTIPTDHSGISFGTDVLDHPAPILTGDPTSGQQLRSMVRNLEADESTFAVQHLMRQSRTLLSETLVPFPCPHHCLEVLSFGAIPKIGVSESEQFVCPDGFVSKVQAAIELRDSNNCSVGQVSLAFKSSVRYINAAAKFLVCTDSGVLVAEGDAPDSAWRKVFGKEGSIIRALAGKLKRCRATFNRLCTSPDAKAFLEKVPSHGIGVHYYQVITAPMWLREIHERLVGGQYENEFDFAWDVRLIFRNCCNYNTPESELFVTAQRLSSLFELLFSRWVLSVVDAGLDIPAAGPWDQWMHLTYFDGEDGHLTSETKSARSKKTASICEWCQSSCATKLRGQSVCICDRCAVAVESGNGSLSENPFANDEHGGGSLVNCRDDAPVFVPASEVGVGWCQSKRKGRSGTKTFYLSPLGYEVSGKEAVNAQKAFEENVNAQLLLTRQKEFSEQHSAKKKRQKRVNGAADLHNSNSFTDDYSFVVGKLHEFELPPEHRMVLLLPKSFARDGQSSAPSFAELHADELTAAGLFGLDLFDVLERVQGLDNFHLCQAYIGSRLPGAIEWCRADVQAKQKKHSEIEEGTAVLMKTLCQERWFWKNQCTYPRATQSLISETAALSPLSGFKPFLLGNLQHSILETIFTLWDFLHSIRDRVGASHFSLLELVKSVNPPSTLLTNCSQMVFDEVGCVLTGYLFDEVRLILQIKGEHEWQNILALHPINVLTWPAVLEKALLIACTPSLLRLGDRLLRASLRPSSSVMLKLLVLLWNHPLFDTFCVTPVSDETTAMDSIGSIAQSVLDDTVDSSAFFESLIDLLKSFTRTHETMGSVYLDWFLQLAKRWGVPENVPAMDVDNEVLTALNWSEVKLCDRSWGGFVHRRRDPRDDFVLKAHDFESNFSVSEIKLKGLLNLERVLAVVSTTDSECWVSADRAVVFATLVDQCMATADYDQRLQRSAVLCTRFFATLPKQEVEAMAKLRDESFKSVHYLPKKARCAFSNISSATIPEPTMWTTVPADFQEAVVETVAKDGLRVRASRSSGKEEVQYALRVALAQVNFCKEAAAREFHRLEDCIDTLVNVSVGGQTKDVYSEASNGATFRALPLGFDRLGNSFWLLGAQESATIFPFDAQGRALDPADQFTAEPCVLCRDRQGQWSYHCGRNINDLVASFSVDIPCERFLRIRLMERYHLVRSKLRVYVQHVRPGQQPWLEKKMNLDRWIAEMTLYNGPNESHRCRQLEVVWARCAESRMSLHYSSLLALDDESLERLPHPLRDELMGLRQLSRGLAVEDCCDHHPTKGWSRPDVFSRIRQIGATTTAAQLLGDGQMCEVVQAALTTSPYVAKGDVLSSAVPIEEIDVDKPVAQIHPITQETLRVFSSVADVAAIFDIQSADVLRAMSDRPVVKLEGFLWKSVDPNVAVGKHLKASVATCLTQTVAEGDVARLAEDSEAWLSLRVKVVSGRGRDQEQIASELRLAYQTPSAPRAQSHIVTSTVTAAAKLIKLKGELLNLLFIFPEKALRWPDQDPATEARIAAAGEAAASQVYSSAAKYTTSGQAPPPSIDLSPENIERLAEKASRKAKRRLRRKTAMDNFMGVVQSATCPQHLTSQIALLESIIPSQLLFHLPPLDFNPASVTLAEIARRVFVLDRRIAYSELQGVEHAALACPFRLRYQCSPRCASNPLCSRVLGHLGKCLPGPHTFSRLPDHFQLAPPHDPFSQQHSGVRDSQSSQYSRNSTAVQNQQARAPPRMRDEDILSALAVLCSRPNADIEAVVPFLPAFQDLAVSEWV